MKLENLAILLSLLGIAYFVFLVATTPPTLASIVAGVIVGTSLPFIVYKGFEKLFDCLERKNR